MKRLLTLTILVTFLLSAGLANSQDVNSMGLFFDLQATTDCINAQVLTPYQTVPLYLMLFYPEFDTLFGFEAGYDIEGPVSVLATQFANPQALDVGSAGNHIVGFGEPTYTQVATLLATITLLYTSSSQEEVCIVLHGSNPSSIDPLFPTVLMADGVEASIGVNNGVQGNCTASIINGICHVASEDTTWDALKTLYR